MPFMTMYSGTRYLIEFALLSTAAGLALVSPAYGLPAGVMLWAIGRAGIRFETVTGGRAMALTVVTGLCLLSLAFQVPQGAWFTSKVTTTGTVVAIVEPAISGATWAWTVFIVWLLAVWQLQHVYRIERWNLVKACEGMVGGGRRSDASAECETHGELAGQPK
jgi:hypothetical protein